LDITNEFPGMCKQGTS